MKHYSLYLIVFLTFGLPLEVHSQSVEDGTIVVSGRGRVTIAPDVGVISLTVESTEASSDSAAAVVATLVQGILNAIVALDVTGVEVVTESYVVQPGRRDQRTQKPIEYKAISNFAVRVAGVTDVGGVIDAALRAGAVQIRGIRFEVSDSDELRRRALAAAIGDANEQAEMIAEAMEVELVFLSATTQPPRYAAGSLALQGIVVTGLRGQRTATPVQPRDAASTVTVTMRYGVVRP